MRTCIMYVPHVVCVYLFAIMYHGYLMYVPHVVCVYFFVIMYYIKQKNQPQAVVLTHVLCTI